MPDFCGNRIYTILEPSASGIVTITPPAAGLSPYTEQWTLTCESTNLADVGVKTFTLQVALELWPLIAPAKKTFVVTILHVCNTTVIQS
jgi:hypothetical protein